MLITWIVHTIKKIISCFKQLCHMFLCPFSISCLYILRNQSRQKRSFLKYLAMWKIISARQKRIYKSKHILIEFETNSICIVFAFSTNNSSCKSYTSGSKTRHLSKTFFDFFKCNIIFSVSKCYFCFPIIPEAKNIRQILQITFRFFSSPHKSYALDIK